MKQKTAETLVFPPISFSPIISSLDQCLVAFGQEKTRSVFFLQIFTRDASQTSVAVYDKRTGLIFCCPTHFPLFREKKNILGLFGHMDRIYSHMDIVSYVPPKILLNV